MKISARMVRDRHIDADVLRFFLTSGVRREYAEQFLSAEQRDEVNVDALLAEIGVRRSWFISCKLRFNNSHPWVFALDGDKMFKVTLECPTGEKLTQTNQHAVRFENS